MPNSHSIKVTEETYQELLALQRTRETFNAIISRLLNAYRLLLAALPVVEAKKGELEAQIEARKHAANAD